MTRLILGALVGVDLLACQQKRSSPGADSAATPLAGTEWTLVTLSGQPAGSGNGGKPATLTLTTPDDRVSGFAGCNRLAGTYQAAGDSLKFGPLILTRMACPSGMDLEQHFAAALDSTRRYRIEDRRLDLLSDAGVVASLESR
jgi:putative lipoprotein